LTSVDEVKHIYKLSDDLYEKLQEMWDTGPFTYVPDRYWPISIRLDLTPLQQSIMFLVFEKTVSENPETGKISAKPAGISIADFVDYLSVPTKVSAKEVMKAKKKLTKSGFLVVVKPSDGITKTLYYFNLDFDKQ